MVVNPRRRHSDTVTVDQTCRRTNKPCGPAEECQIQLLYKPRVVSGNKSAARFVLKWGLKQADGKDKPIRGCISASNPPPCFVPTLGTLLI